MVVSLTVCAYDCLRHMLAVCYGSTSLTLAPFAAIALHSMQACADAVFMVVLARVPQVLICATVGAVFPSVSFAWYKQPRLLGYRCHSPSREDIVVRILESLKCVAIESLWITSWELQLSNSCF